MKKMLSSPFSKGGKRSGDWIRRHDDTYDHDYFEDQATGRVTWSSHQTHSDAGSQPGSPSSVLSTKTPTGTSSPSSVGSVKTVNSQLSIKRSNETVLGGSGGGLLDDTYNPMSGKQEDHNTTISWDESATPSPSRRKKQKRGFMKRLTSWNPRSSISSSGGSVNSFGVPSPPASPGSVQMKVFKGQATLGDDLSSLGKESYDYHNDPKYLAGRARRWFVFLVFAAVFFFGGGFGMAYVLTEGFTTWGDESGPEAASEVPVLSEEEVNSRLSFAACSEDKAFLRQILRGEDSSTVQLTDDISIHSIAAKIEVVNEVPTVSIVRGKVSFESTLLLLDMLPTKLSPALDTSLCGQRMFEIPVTVRQEPVDMKTDMGVNFPLTLDSATGLLRFTTSRKVNKNELTSVGENRRLINKEDRVHYYVDFFTIQGTAVLGQTPSLLSPIYSANEDVDINIDFHTTESAFTATLTDPVSVDFEKLVTTSTCLQFAPLELIAGVNTAPNTMAVSYNLIKGLTVSGRADITGSLQSITTAPNSVSTDIEFISPPNCVDPYFRVLTPAAPPPTTAATATKTISTIKTVKFERLSNATTVTATERMLVDARGGPVNIEVDENGEGVVVDDKWSIFSRPKPYTPPFVADVVITSQATEGSKVSSPYYTEKLTQRTRLYNDRPYRYDRFPKFLEDMTVVLPSNEDAAWPGEFEKDNMDSLFCVSTTENTPAVYVIISNEMLNVPDWLSVSYQRLQNAEIGSQTISWTSWSSRYNIYWRPLNGDDEPCFGLNGEQLDLMYTVAFGDLPPSSITRFDEESEEEIIDDNFTNDFELRDGIVHLDFDDKGSPHSLYIAGELTLYIGFVKSVVPVTVFFHTDLSNFRFTAHNVEVTSFTSAISAVAPTTSPAPLMEQSHEVSASFKADILFSTFDEDMGLRISTKTNFVMLETELTPMMQNVLFDALIAIPFGYNHTHNFFTPGDPHKFKFRFDGTAEKIKTKTGNSLTNAEMKINVTGTTVSTFLKSDLHLNFTENLIEEGMLSCAVEFFLPDFNLNSTASVTTATFSGLITDPVTPTAAPWMTLRSGGLYGTVDFSSSSFTVMYLELFSYPTMTFEGNFDHVEGDARFKYKHPSTWSIDLTVNTVGSEVVREMVEKSLSAVSAESLDMYVSPSVIVDSELSLHLASRDEYFKLSVDIESSKIAPELLLGASAASLSMVVSASETDTKNVSAYTMSLETEIDRLEFGDHFELQDIEFKASADLTSVKSKPDLTLSLDSSFIIKFGNESVGDLKIDGVINGLYEPYENKTRINTSVQLDENGWVVNPQLKLTSGLLRVSGTQLNGNWTFDPVDYEASGQYLLEGDAAAGDSRYLMAKAAGRVDNDKDLNIIKVRSSLGPSEKAFERALPTTEYSIPAAQDVSVLTGDFSVCISTEEVVFGEMNCIDGVVIESVVVVDSFLSSFLSPFGYKGSNATVGMEVSASLPRQEDLLNSLSVEAVFAGRGLSLSPSITLKKVFMKTTDWDDVDYDFEVSVELVNGAELILTGEGSFEGEEKRTEAVLKTSLTNSIALLPNFNILQSCVFQMDLKHSNSTGWEAADLSWSNCGTETILPSSSSSSSSSRSSLLAISTGSVNALSSDFHVVVSTKVDNLADAISAILNVSAAELIPYHLQSVEILDSTNTTILLNSAADTVKVTVKVDVSTVSEVIDAVAALDLSSPPDLFHVSCEIQTKMSTPHWNETSVKFLFAAHGFSIGPIDVETFELEVDRNTDQNTLEFQSSSVFTVLDQKFVLKGVTSFDDSVTTANLTAAFLPNQDNKLYLFFDKIHVTDGSLNIYMTKTDGEEEFEIKSAKLIGKSKIHYSPQLYSDSRVMIKFTDDLRHYIISLEALSSVDVFDFLPSFPTSDFRLTSRSDLDFKYSSKTMIASVGLKSQVVSSLVVDPLRPLLPDISGITTWDLEMETNVTESNDFWSFTGTFSLEDVAIGTNFKISSGSLTVEVGDKKNISFSFDIDSAFIIADTFLTGKNESISATFCGKYNSDKDILELTGTSVEAFHPLGQEYLTIDSAIISAEIQAPELELVKVEAVSLMTTSFTDSQITSEFVCLKNCQKVFVRATNIAVSDLENVFDKVNAEKGHSISASTKSELSPAFSMDLFACNLTVSNFENSNFQVERGFSFEAAGVLEGEDSNLEAKIISSKDNAFKSEFRLRLFIDFLDANNIDPRLDILFVASNLELFDGVEIIGFTFNCDGLMSHLDIQLSTVVSVDLPALEAPLITTVEGDFDLNITNGTAEIDTDWTAQASTKLAQTFKWNPMGLEIFKLSNPHLHLHFSDDEDTPENDVELDKLVISSANTSLSEYVTFNKPKFQVLSFDPQEFQLESGLTISYNTPMPLQQNIFGSFKEEDVEGERGTAELRSELTEDWWPLGNSLLVVEDGSRLNTTMATSLGKLQSINYEGRVNVTFDYEWMEILFEGASSGDLERFCFIARDVPVVSIAKVLGSVLVGEDAVLAANNWLLGEGGGVDLDIDAAVYDESGGVFQAAINIGSYAQDCAKFSEAPQVDGHRVELTLEAGDGGNLVYLWKMLVDGNTEKLVLESEIVVPNVRSEAHPLLLAMDLKSESEGEESSGISIDNARIELAMEDPASLAISSINVGLLFTIRFGDGQRLSFDVNGKAIEQDVESVDSQRNNTKTYDVDLHGSTTSLWSQPFGLKWLEISKGSIDVKTTSELEWKDTDVRMQLNSRFAFNASVEIELDALVKDGGSDLVLEGILSGDNVQLLGMLGSVASESGIESKDVAKYFSEILTEERVSFALATMENRFYDEYDLILGDGIRKGVTLNVNLLNKADGGEFDLGNDKLSQLVGAFIGADSELDMELWVGIFDDVEAEEGKEALSVPPVSLALRNRGANLVFGNGFVEIVDWEAKASYVSALSTYPTLEAAASMIFRPSDSDELKVRVAGGPGYLSGEMVGIWYSPFNLTWLDVGDLKLDMKFGEDGEGGEGGDSGAKSDWGWGITECELAGTGVLGGKFGGKTQAVFLDNMEDLMLATQLFYDFDGEVATELVDAIAGGDVIGELGRRKLDEVGDQTCGGSFISVPTTPLNGGDVGRNVTFLQQLLEDVGYLDAKNAGTMYDYGTLGSVTETAVGDFMTENDVFATADGNLVNYDVWFELCKKSEEAGAVVVGGEREWLAEFRMPPWLKNTLWEARYSTYDDAGGAWKKGVTVSASVNVRERGVTLQALDMLGFTKKYQDMGEFSPLLSAGVYVPTFSDNPTHVNAWIEANDFEVYDNVYCKKIRFDFYAGWPLTMALGANILVDFEDSPNLEMFVEGLVEVGEVGVQKAVLENRVKGTWEDVFGLEGLILTQVGVQVGVSITNSADLELGTTTVYVGVAAEFIIGTAVITMTGRAGGTELGMPGKELLLQGSLTGDVDAGMIMGQAISFRDIAEWYVKDILKDEDGKIWGFDVTEIPEEWGLYDTYFQLSTSQVEMFDKVFPPGIAFSTGLSIFGIDCSVTMAVVMVEVNGEMVPDFEWQVVEGLEAAEEIARRKLLDEILPEKLIDPAKLTNDERRIKEKDDNLDFENPVFQMTGISLKNLNFLSIAGGERPILVIKFKFFGVAQTLEIETLTIRELYELDLWGKLEAFRVFADTLFSLPDCLWDSQCYNDEAGGYCQALCDPSSPSWYGECPEKTGLCYIDDEDCFKCFGTCALFQCWY
mmetsp:Transcript_2433/g.4395  ORF Transcript_2433/g.4395 Transcript_2433/m.4395 type:complete len:3690 (-) Transcript_2433:60-11129(-)